MARLPDESVILRFRDLFEARRYHHEAGNRWLRGLVIQLFAIRIGGVIMQGLPERTPC